MWLGLDHGFISDAPPLIFETMVFDQSEYTEHRFSDLECERYATEAAALAGHDRMVADIRARLTLKPMETEENK